MQRYKSSAYNEWIPVPELSEYLLYNTINGGIEVLAEAPGVFFSDLAEDESISQEEHPVYGDIIRYLADRGFLVDAAIDEKELVYNRYKNKQSLLYERESANIGLTIGTTIICNMGCPYCFEFVKPNKTLKDDTIFRQIASYIVDMIAKSPVRVWKAMTVTWYGGEPLINSMAIERLTPELLKICDQYGIAYRSSIITNGLLLTPDMWHKLLENKVTSVQVTIDGPMATHERKRPLKTLKKENNYWKILENLCYLPDGIKAYIRMNVDKQVAAGFEELLDDFAAIGLWPQRFDSIQFSPAWLRSYEETVAQDTGSEYLSNEAFFDELQRFRRLRLDRFNKWAVRNNIAPGKLKWVMPELQEECSTWVSPYSLVIDPEGFIHKCWETIHNSGEGIGHVSDGFQLNQYEKYMNYDRYQLNDICSKCKYLPVCDQLACSHQAIKYNKPPCTYWKEKTAETLKRQYITWKADPDSLSLPENLTHSNSGHANK